MLGLDNKGKIEKEFGSLPKPIMLRITAYIHTYPKAKVGSISFMKLVRLSCYCPLYFDRFNACK